MVRMTKYLVVTFMSLMAMSAKAQTDISLFWRKDSVQLTELKSDEPYLYKLVGHHGPAVENQYMILRLYYRDGGAIDLYSKANKGLELAKYHWYPSNEAIEKGGAGCDEYRVGKTVGLGGIALWDGEKEVKLVATKGRDSKVYKTKGGAVAEMLHRGVVYNRDTIDVKVSIEMFNERREALISAECVSGQKVQFLTGVNYHKGQTMDYCGGRIAVWGIHPADIIEHPLPIGGGMIFDRSKWTEIVKTDDMLQIVSNATTKVQTLVTAACSREKKVNNEKRFFRYVKKAKRSGLKMLE